MTEKGKENLILVLIIVVLFLGWKYAVCASSSSISFRDYSTATGATFQADLYKQHPIGSDADALKETLVLAGARRYAPKARYDYDAKNIDSTKWKNASFYQYISYPWQQLFFRRVYGLIIFVDQDNKIKHITVNIGQDLL